MPNYVRTKFSPGAKIFLVGEAPGKEEDKSGEPFVGPAGRILNQSLEQAGLNRVQVTVGNVARLQPPGNKIAFYFEDAKCTIPKPILLKWREELRQEIISSKPNIVVALGATAMWALLGTKGMIENRGYIQESTLVPKQKVLVTWHPQKIGYEWKLGFQLVMDLRKARENSHTPEFPVDDRVLAASPSVLEFEDYLKFLLYSHKDPVCLDLEVVDTSHSHIGIIGLADSPNHAMSFQLFQGAGREARLSLYKELEILYLLARVLDKRTVIAHNGLYDIPVLWLRNRILCRNYTEDTLIMAHIAWPEVPRSLAFLSSICLNVPKWKHTSSLTPTLYNAADAANTYGVWNKMNVEIDRLNARETYKFEMMQVWPAMMMHLQGVDIDREVQQNLIKSTQGRVSQLEEEIETAAGKKINIGSPKQLQTLLYIDMKLPVQYKRRKSRLDERKITTDAVALRKLLRTTNNPLLIKIQEYKKALKLLTFLDIPISPEGKVYTSYNVTGATMQRSKKGLVVDDEDSYKSFGRWSSSKSIILPYGSGNHQNIPQKARKMYKAPTGYVFVQADYVQAEAVVVSYLIGDNAMIKMFKDSFGATKAERKANFWDIHLITAHQMFGVPLDQVTSEMRDVGKTLRHATNYSAGAGVVDDRIGCGLSEAKILLERYHQSCPQLRLWHESIQKELYKTRTLANLLGRSHRFLERWPDSRTSSEGAPLFRSAYSYIPQSTIGDLLNIALIRLYNNYPEISPVLQLHDAIYTLTLANPQAIQETLRTLQKCMYIPLSVNYQEFYIDVDFKYGKYWGDLQEIEIERGDGQEYEQTLGRLDTVVHSTQ